MVAAMSGPLSLIAILIDVLFKSSVYTPPDHSKITCRNGLIEGYPDTFRATVIVIPLPEWRARKPLPHFLQANRPV